MKLPEPAAGYMHGCNIELADGQDLYTADQMRKYRADGIAEAEAAYIEAVRLHNLTLDELRASESFAPQNAWSKAFPSTLSALPALEVIDRHIESKLGKLR
jgi:hypothetical protein